MTFNCTQYELGTKFPSQTKQESQVFKEQTEKSVQQKGGNHLLSSGLKNKGGKLRVLIAEEQTTTSALLKS